MLHELGCNEQSKTDRSRAPSCKTHRFHSVRWPSTPNLCFEIPLERINHIYDGVSCVFIYKYHTLSLVTVVRDSFSVCPSKPKGSMFSDTVEIPSSSFLSGLGLGNIKMSQKSEDRNQSLNPVRQSPPPPAELWFIQRAGLPDHTFKKVLYFFLAWYFFFHKNILFFRAILFLYFFSYFIIFLGFFFLILKTSLLKRWKIFARLRRELFLFDSLCGLKQFGYKLPGFASPLLLQNLLKESNDACLNLILI